MVIRRNLTSPPSAAEPGLSDRNADRRSRRHARCPSGCRRSPSRCRERSPWDWRGTCSSSSKLQVPPLRLQGGREIEPAATVGLLLVDDAVEVRADAVGTALLEGVAGRAFLGGAAPFSTEAVCSSFSIGSDGAAASLPAARRVFLHRNVVAGLGRLGGAKIAPAVKFVTSRTRQVPRTAPRILLSSKESIRSGSRPEVDLRPRTAG